MLSDSRGVPVICILLLECRQVIGFASLRHPIGSKNSRHFFIQSELKPKPTVTSHTFSRALRQLHVIISSFDWFIVLSVPFMIG